MNGEISGEACRAYNDGEAGCTGETSKGGHGSWCCIRTGLAAALPHLTDAADRRRARMGVPVTDADWETHIRADERRRGLDDAMAALDDVYRLGADDAYFAVADALRRRFADVAPPHPSPAQVAAAASGAAGGTRGGNESSAALTDGQGRQEGPSAPSVGSVGASEPAEGRSGHPDAFQTATARAETETHWGVDHGPRIVRYLDEIAARHAADRTTPRPVMRRTQTTGPWQPADTQED